MSHFSLVTKGKLVEFSRPVVMGILNATPDSFYSASRLASELEVAHAAERMVLEGAGMLDLGAYSSRPGAADVPPEEELKRLETAVKAVRKAVGDDIPLSIDTFRSLVALKAVGEWGADIVNDISGGEADSGMFAAVAELRCPYVLMHMRGTPATMQTMTDYGDVTSDVVAWLSHRLRQLEELGVADVVVDPGFGFAKTTEQNYRMLAELRQFELLGRPLLAGMSRKSMITKVLGCDSGSGAALAATTALNVLALERGASILRVHDVEAASAAVEMFVKMENALHPEHT